MTERKPWMKFYAQDWLGDPRLRACSAGARGLWIDLISLAHEAMPYGHVLINGKPPDAAIIARIVGLDVSEVEMLLMELGQNGVFSRTREGVVFCRKMVRMEKKSVFSRKIGKLGGNPSLSKSTTNSGVVNPTDNPEVKTQRPEAKLTKRKYAFEGRVIRLTASDYDRWRNVYKNIPNLEAELTNYDDYLSSQNLNGGKWFARTSSYLRNRDAEHALKSNKPRSKNPQPHELNYEC